MNHETIERQGIVERYVAGKLAADEAAAFEEHYLSCPVCLDALEAAEELRAGLKDVAAEDAAAQDAAVESAAAPRPEPSHGLLAWIGSGARSPRVGLAAAAALVAVALPIGWLALELSQERERAATLDARVAELSSPRPNVRVLPLSPERGESTGGPAVRTRRPTTPAPIVLLLELEGEGHARYRAALEDASGERLWSGADLAPDHTGSLSLSFDSAFLEPGDYELVVEGLAGEESWVPAGRFAFRLLPESD